MVEIEHKFGMYFWTDPETGEVVTGRTEAEARAKVRLHKMRE